MSSAQHQGTHCGHDRRSGMDRRAGNARRSGSDRRAHHVVTAATPHAAVYRGADGAMHVHGWYADFAEAKRQAAALKALHGCAGVFTSEADDAPSSTSGGAA